MCLSHYGHLNEYSHILAQNFIAIMKHKKEKLKSVKNGKTILKDNVKSTV